MSQPPSLVARATPAQANQSYRIYLRFCTCPQKTDTETNRQKECQDLDDLFPPMLSIMVNHSQIPFQPLQMEKNRQVYSKPVDITDYLKLSEESNLIKVEWDEDFSCFKTPEIYFMSACFCRALSYKDVIQKISRQSKIRKEDTLELMFGLQENYKGSDCAPTRVKVALTCPVLGTRIKFACRGLNCKHYNCFDLLNYIRMEYKANNSKIKCPVCKIPLKVQDIRLDMFCCGLARSVENRLDLKAVTVDNSGRLIINISRVPVPLQI